MAARCRRPMYSRSSTRLIAIRIVGACLVLLGSANLAGLWFAELSMLQSPTAVLLRYTLMVIAGAGFVLARRWAIHVYLTSLLINWVLFYTLYDGRSLGPIWLSFPIPIAIIALTYFAWGKMKPGLFG